jgi:methyl-accepting chemotaxis protein
VKQIAGNVNNLMATASTTAASVAQMDATIKQVEQNAQGASVITENVRHDALVGQEAVAATISGIGEISSSTQFTLTAIDNLSSRVKAIGNILLVINELADQTNLLALNSAIIAAQAGEHGKGFAVVSDQIKRLAMRTRNSTQEIADLIAGIQKETGQASEAIKTTEKRVAEGVLLSRKSGDALQKIVSGMEMTLCQVNDIASTTVEQAKGSQQIRQAMELVSEMVTQIAKSTQEQGATSGFITSSVDRMKELTEYVKTSSHEQRNLGLEIAGSTNSITGIVGEVERLRNDLSKRSQMIRMAIQEMHQANNADLAVVKVMEEGVDNLSRQIAIIQNEMAKLRA